MNLQYIPYISKGHFYSKDFDDNIICNENVFTVELKLYILCLFYYAIILIYFTMNTIYINNHGG